ncbi:MAG: DUF202 domain-containing protein [Elainellaceae cyanobacterium]
MNEPLLPPYPPNVQAELARDRNRAAADRTLLSFIRSSVILITAGVSIDRVFRTLSPAAPALDVWIYGLNLVLIGLGVINLLFAALDYQGEIRRLKQPIYSFTPRRSLGAATGWTLLLVGLLALLRLG